MHRHHPPPPEMIQFGKYVEYIFGRLLDWEFYFDETQPDRLYSIRSILHEIVRLYHGEQRTWNVVVE